MSRWSPAASGAEHPSSTRQDTPIGSRNASARSVRPESTAAQGPAAAHRPGANKFEALAPSVQQGAVPEDHNLSPGAMPTRRREDQNRHPEMEARRTAVRIPKAAEQGREMKTECPAQPAPRPCCYSRRCCRKRAKQAAQAASGRTAGRAEGHCRTEAHLPQTQPARRRPVRPRKHRCVISRTERTFRSSPEIVHAGEKFYAMSRGADSPIFRHARRVKTNRHLLPGKTSAAADAFCTVVVDS